MSQIAKSTLTLGGGRKLEYRKISVLRGGAVLLMLWGHAIQYLNLGEFDVFDNKVFQFIYSFHMPLFMLISGYLFYYSFSKRTMKQILLHKIKYIIWSIIGGGILYYLLVPVVREVLSGKALLLCLIGGKWIEYMTIYWFLWSVLASSLVIAVTFNLRLSRFGKCILLILGMFFVACFPNWQNNVFVYPYFVIGFLFNKYKYSQAVKHLYKVRWVSPFIYILMFFFFNRDCFIYTSGLMGTEGFVNHMPMNFFRWGIGLFGSIATVTILLYLLRNNNDSVIFNFIEKIGDKSLEIYILSCIFLSIYLPKLYEKLTGIIGHNVLANNMLIYNFIITVIVGLLYSVILYWLAKILEYIGIGKIIFGR